MDNSTLKELTPKQIVEQLDVYIVGQKKAKKSVAIALRNRTRRLKLPDDIREEIAPKNILMIGPTGVGKTEIARRLAKLYGAPFLKVEATKYTEVGYVGRDVESMIRDLMAVGVKIVKTEMQEQLKSETEDKVEEDILDLLLPGSRKIDKKGDEKVSLALPATDDTKNDSNGNSEKNNETQESTREKFRKMLKEGKLEDRKVEVTVQKKHNVAPMEIIAGGAPEDMENVMQGFATMLNGGKNKKKTVSIAEAREILRQEHLERMIDPDTVADIAKERVEQTGIIFIDEIDKIAVSDNYRDGGVSREGVQRDILPIVEGSTVNTKYGVIDTTHILFIAAGAFNLSKPSDLIPELQGRFPLRVELDSLTAEDFKQILTEPKNALTAQYTQLLATEGVTITFAEEAITHMSTLAAEVNSNVENIGARRLHTIMETLLEDLSFEADEHAGETIEITKAYVDEKLKNIVQNQDLSKYIL